MGGIDKPGLELGGVTLRERAIQAATNAGLAPVVHVGAETGDGPAAALAAGLEQVANDEVVVLAGDLVRPDLVIEALGVAAAEVGAPAGRDGLVLVDPGGREQWLAARYRVRALREAIAALPDGPRGTSLRAITRGLDLARVPVDTTVVADIDTWQDYEAARASLDERA